MQCTTGCMRGMNKLFICDCIAISESVTFLKSKCITVINSFKHKKIIEQFCDGASEQNRMKAEQVNNERSSEVKE